MITMPKTRMTSRMKNSELMNREQQNCGTPVETGDRRRLPRRKALSLTVPIGAAASFAAPFLSYATRQRISGATFAECTSTVTEHRHMEFALHYSF
jgi:hypothetical protein